MLSFYKMLLFVSVGLLGIDPFFSAFGVSMSLCRVKFDSVSSFFLSFVDKYDQGFGHLAPYIHSVLIVGKDW